jgi:hypothetical protein
VCAPSTVHGLRFDGGDRLLVVGLGPIYLVFGRA